MNKNGSSRTKFPNTKSQLKLGNFCNEYDMSRTTVLDLIYTQHFPAYKIGGRWYVDMKKFKEWRGLYDVR